MTITQVTDAGHIHQHNKIILATNAPKNVAVQFIKKKKVNTSDLNDEEWAFMLVNNELGYFTRDGDSQQNYDNRNGALHEISTQLNSFKNDYPQASIYFCDTPDNIHTITLGDYFVSVERKRQELGNIDEIQKPWWSNKLYMLGAGMAVVLIAGGAYWWWTQKNKKAKKEVDESDDEEKDTHASKKKGSSRGNKHKSGRKRAPQFDDYDIEEDNDSDYDYD